MVGEVLAFLSPQPGHFFLDATVGAGGHAAELLSRALPGGWLAGLDRDRYMLGLAARRLASFPPGTWRLVPGRFGCADDLSRAAAEESVDGAIMDLGMNSEQLDDPARGFSFLSDGPLDMRMSPEDRVTAADIVNTWPARDLSDLIYRLGEEPSARRIASAVVRARTRARFRTTGDLARLVERVAGRHRRHHPATRTFQALRMEVNHELEELERGLPLVLSRLKPGGRLAVIAFHSLEDRVVKRYLRAAERRGELSRINRKVARPSPEECRENPRSRSARLRLAVRVPRLTAAPGTGAGAGEEEE